jgi:transposase
MITGFGDNSMTKTEGDGITSGRRRRRWSRAEKERIVAAAMEPGVIASAIARDAKIHASQLFRWRQQLHGASQYASLTVEVPPDPAPITARPMQPGVIEVVFATGARLRISGPVDTPIVSAVMQALADCGRR